MTYAVKEVFYTLQGEGARSGRPSVFIRFAGCNLWSGLEKDRATAICQFCDTEFFGTDGLGGGHFKTAEELAEAASAMWAGDSIDGRYAVCTGGEPLLQLDVELIEALHRHGFEVAVETNGTRVPPPGLDWICVSPKAGAPLVLKNGNELKVVMPQEALNLEELATLPFTHFFVQPMDGPAANENTQAAIDFCLHNPKWRLSIQTHKLLGLR